MHSQSCPTLCNLVDCSPLGSSVHGIFQARTLGWVAIPFCRRSSWPRDGTFVSCIGRQILYHWAIWKAHVLSSGGLVAKLCPTLATPRIVAHWIPLSMGFSRQEYWSRLPFPSPGDLSDQGIEPRSPMSPALQPDSLPAEPLGKW